jgi:serine/threonine protein kinase
MENAYVSPTLVSPLPSASRPTLDGESSLIDTSPVTDIVSGSTFYLSPECQGGLFERLDSYNTETNDIWSLGVILVNLTCGRNPWRQACPQDETFRAYVHDPDFLRTILPISHATNHILKGLFALDPKDRVSLRTLRKLVLAVDTFTMTEDELRHAHSAARAAAAAVRPKGVVAPVVAPVEPIVNVIDHNGAYAHIEVDVPAGHQDWSAHSTYADIDQNVLDQIDYQQQHVRPQVVPAHYAQLASSEPDTPSLVGGAADPYALRPTHSRSSSSGDASLPPTPEFNPADKTQGGGAVPEWNLANKKMAEQDRPAYANPPHIRNPFSLI